MPSDTRGLRIAGLEVLPVHDCIWQERPGWSHTGWAVSKLVMAGLLTMYLVGWVQDLQRLSRLEAEPPPLSKIIVITKYEAWHRIHSRLAR
ncbi:MAG: hypothetical protein HY712_00515 [candidate division NC10 bacterium]|nr:hypothetical protein [candidate division NC10 bacterium]